MTRFKTAGLVSTLVLTAAASALEAGGTFKWTAANNPGTWSTTANWQLVPGSGTGLRPGAATGVNDDVAIIDLTPGYAYVVQNTTNYNGSLKLLTLDSPDATLDLGPSTATNLRALYFWDDGDTATTTIDLKRGTVRIFRGSGSTPAFEARTGSPETMTMKIGAGTTIDVQTFNGINATIVDASGQIVEQKGTIQVGVNGSGPYFQSATVFNGFTNEGFIKLSNQRTGAPTDGATPDSNTSFVVTTGTLTNKGTIEILKGASDMAATYTDAYGTRDINRRDLVLVLDNQGTLDVQNQGAQAARLGLVAASANHTNSGLIKISANTALALTANNTLTNQIAGQIAGKGTLDVTAAGASLINDGQLVAGGAADTGTLTIKGNVVNSSTAKLSIELGSAGSDQLVITDGSIALDGLLDVSLLGGFDPIGGSFTVLSGSYTGSFDNTVGNKLALGNGYQFDVAYNPTSVVLSNYALVPEPATMGLLLLGGLSLLGRRKHA